MLSTMSSCNSTCTHIQTLICEKGAARCLAPDGLVLLTILVSTALSFISTFWLMAADGTLCAITRPVAVVLFVGGCGMLTTALVLIDPGPYSSRAQYDAVRAATATATAFYTGIVVSLICYSCCRQRRAHTHSRQTPVPARPEKT